MHITSARTFSGTERHVVDLCHGLESRGHEVFAAVRPTNEWDGRLGLADDRLLRVSIRNSFGMFSAKRISRFARQNSIDIIHAHVARDYITASAAARMANTRFILTRHVMPPMKAFHRFALRNVDAAIAVSEAVRSKLAGVFPPEIIYMIPNGIEVSGQNLPEAERAGLEFREFHRIPVDSKLVVTIGELKVAKGQRDLVLAANEILKIREDVHFVVAGVDNTLDQKFRRELRRLVRVFGIEDKFLWLGWLDDIGPLLSAADVFVSPSHAESFGIAILEAMSAGCAVVTTNTDGAVELIDDDRARVPIKDPLRLAETIGWYLDHEHERQELGKRLQASASLKYGIDAMVDATEAVYRRVV
jgi:glycosyltransferase involved in cell wall biosynthesis